MGDTMRLALLLTAAIAPATAQAQTMESIKVAQNIALIEWAEETCGIKPSFDISDMLATVMADGLHGMVMLERMGIDKMYRRHGKESACRAAEKAFSKMKPRGK